MESLSTREFQVMELTAWGLSAKEVADRINVSTFTVQNHIAHIKTKLSLQKVTEIAAVFFCIKFNISMDLSPLKRQIGAVVLLFVFAGQMAFSLGQMRESRRECETRIEERVEA